MLLVIYLQVMDFTISIFKQKQMFSIDYIYSNMPKKICNKDMSFQDCELAILRMSVDKAQEKVARRAVASPASTELTNIVEELIIEKGLVPY